VHFDGRLVGNWPLLGTHATTNTFLLVALFVNALFAIGADSPAHKSRILHLGLRRRGDQGAQVMKLDSRSGVLHRPPGRAGHPVPWAEVFPVTASDYTAQPSQAGTETSFKGQFGGNA
jgi:hypothetical protein